MQEHGLPRQIEQQRQCGSALEPAHAGVHHGHLVVEYLPRCVQDRIQRRLRSEGVTIVSSHSVYVQDGVSVGQDTVIHPFSFIGCDSRIGQGCEVGPFVSLPPNSIVPEGTRVSNNVETSASVGGGGRSS